MLTETKVLRLNSVSLLHLETFSRHTQDQLVRISYSLLIPINHLLQGSLRVDFSQGLSTLPFCPAFFQAEVHILTLRVQACCFFAP